MNFSFYFFPEVLAPSHVSIDYGGADIKALIQEGLHTEVETTSLSNKPHLLSGNSLTNCLDGVIWNGWNRV